MASPQRPEQQPADTVWLRSTALGITRPFAPAHAAALLALEQKQGHQDWHDALPEPTPDTTAPEALKAADDSPTRRRPTTTRKPR